ncbi:hypothetical protein PG994_012253 [Apiospora phragmitis]|uniref:Uncharacterized protein n=1 Tax=Apiospora phragmitis TaxID=2905665 RepID=A0ABR1TXR7_9PEZI
MLSPTRASPNASQDEELLRTAKSLRRRFAEAEPVNIDTSPSQRASATKQHKTIAFAPFRASHSNLPGPKMRDAVKQDLQDYSVFDYTKEHTGGFASYARSAVPQNTGYIEELLRKNGSYNGAHIRNEPSPVGIERQYRHERGYPQVYHTPQPQQPYYRSPQSYSHAQRHLVDPRQLNASQQQSYSACRSRSRSPSPESPVVTELEERYHKLRLALHSKAMNGLEKVEKDLVGEVTTSINACINPVAQLDQQFCQEAAQAEIELIGKELLARPPYGEVPGSSKEGRRDKGTNGMKSRLDGLLAEFSKDLECMSRDVVEEMSKYEKKLCEKVDSELGKIMGAFLAGFL